MKEMYVISIIGFIYSVILALVTLIFFPDYLSWAILGSATALFNHSLTIRITKGKFNAQNYMAQILLRYVFYIIIIVIVWLDTKDLPGNTMIYSYIFLILGISSVKIGVFVYHLPWIKKLEVKEVKDDAGSDH